MKNVPLRIIAIIVKSNYTSKWLLNYTEWTLAINCSCKINSGIIVNTACATCINLFFQTAVE